MLLLLLAPQSASRTASGTAQATTGHRRASLSACGMYDDQATTDQPSVASVACWPNVSAVVAYASLR